MKTKIKIWLLWIVFSLWGCSSAPVTPGATLLAAMKRYEREMAAIGSRPERWPERQRMAGTLKSVAAVTLDRPAEFHRLIDLDLKIIEFAITIRTLSPGDGRLQDMTTAIAAMRSEAAAVVERMHGQVAAIPVAVDDKIPTIATKGLLTIALSSFVSGNNDGIALTDPSAQVEGYRVSDLGGFAAVRAPDGQIFRCTVLETEEDGAGMRCQTAK